MPIRNCRSTISQVMDSLLEQDMPPAKIIIVDDGSTDGTSDILAKYTANNTDKIEVITTNNQTRDYRRLVLLWNMCLRPDYDYHMILAGDIILPKNYAASIIHEMDKDADIVISSGVIAGKNTKMPQGAGRFVNQSFFYNNYNKYPNIVGYESEILYRARILGYKLAVFDDIQFQHVDELGHKHNFTEFGWGMRALGYHPLYVLGRALLPVFGKSDMKPQSAFRMLWYYLTYKPQKDGYYSQFPAKFRQNVRTLQASEMRQTIRKIFRS